MRLCRTLYATGAVNRWCDRPARHAGPCAGHVLPRYRVGQSVRITDPVRLALRMHRASPDGRLYGAGYGAPCVVPRDVLDTPATIHALARDCARMLVGWRDGSASVWIDMDDAVPA